MKRLLLFLGFASSVLLPTPAMAIVVPEHSLTVDAAIFPAGHRVQRFMTKLANKEPVLVAYAGQSGINPGNTWMGMVMQDLKKRFPGAVINESNQAVGGCAADCMFPQIDTRFKGLNPDLVFLYISGAEMPYEGILQKLRANIPSTSEIVLINYHVWISPNESEATFSNYHSYFFDAELADKYNCAFINIRDPWNELLIAKKQEPSVYLVDAIHFNAAGQALMASLIGKYFVKWDPDVTGPRAESIAPASATRLIVKFNERVDRATAEANANYTIDGAQVTSVHLSHNEAYAIVGTTPLSPGTHSLTVANVKDLAGNVATAAAKPFVTSAVKEWRNKDIGASRAPGVTVHAEGTDTFVLTSNQSGSNPWKAEGQYAFKVAYGDSEIVAHVAALKNTIDTATAGVQIREESEWASKVALLGLSAGGTAQFSTRSNLGDWYATAAKVSGKAIPQWLKLTRVGNTFSAFTSVDKASWQSVGTAVIEMGNEVTIGVFATAGKYDQTSTASFDSVAVKTSDAPALAMGPMTPQPRPDGGSAGAGGANAAEGGGGTSPEGEGSGGMGGGDEAEDAGVRSARSSHGCNLGARSDGGWGALAVLAVWLTCRTRLRPPSEGKRARLACRACRRS